MLWRYFAIILALLICLAGGAANLALASRRKRLAQDRGAKHVEGVAEIASQAAFSSGLTLIAATNFISLSRLTTFPSDLAVPVGCALILVLVLGIQLGRLLLRYQLSRLPGELDTVTGKIVAKLSK